MSGICGTHAGYYRHRRRGEPPCEACTAAASAHHRRFVAARNRALSRLSRAHPDEFRTMYREELNS